MVLVNLTEPERYCTLAKQAGVMAKLTDIGARTSQSAPTGVAGSTLRMQCMQVWGGSGLAETSISTTGLDVWLYSKPFANSRAGGDVCYLSSCSSGRITRLVLADVRGHGERAVELADSLRGLMRRHINHVSQTALVRAINAEFVSVGDASTFATGLILTFFVPTSTLTLTNAGHPSPLLFSASRAEWGRLEQVLSSTGPADVPLGIFESANYSQLGVRLTTEDRLLCFTDGLEECVDERGEALGRDGILRLVAEIDPAEPDRILPELLRRVTSMNDRNLFDDDVTVLLVRPNGASVPLRDNVLAPFRYLLSLAGLKE